MDFPCHRFPKCSVNEWAVVQSETRVSARKRSTPEAQQVWAVCRQTVRAAREGVFWTVYAVGFLWQLPVPALCGEGSHRHTCTDEHGCVPNKAFFWKTKQWFCVIHISWNIILFSLTIKNLKNYSQFPGPYKGRQLARFSLWVMVCWPWFRRMKKLLIN